MDRKQEQFLRMQQYQYAPRMPFYMSYPVQNIYMTEMEYERDMERMKELYPKEAKQIQKLVEDECDQMEYEGSMMFDEYPDRVMLKVICDRIYQNATKPQNTPDSIITARYGKAAGVKGEALKEGAFKEEVLNGNALNTEEKAGENTADRISDVILNGTLNKNEETGGELKEGAIAEGDIKAGAAIVEAEGVSGQDFWQGPGRPPGPPGPPPPGRPPGPPGPPPPPGWQPGPPPGWQPGPPPRNPGLNTLIEVLLYNEMYKRRCRHNRCRRWW